MILGSGDFEKPYFRIDFQYVLFQLLDVTFDIGQQVDFVDDAGQIQMIWDNGRTLPLIENEDSFEIIDTPKINI